MNRALVIALPEKGHYLPLIAPATALRDSGAEVIFSAAADIADELAAFDVTNTTFPPGALPPSGELRGQSLANLLLDQAALASWIRRLLVDEPARRVAETRALIRDVRPDVIAFDTMAYDAAIAAELEGIPWVGWATSLNAVVPEHFDSALIRTTTALDPERERLFAEHGMSVRFRISDVLSPRGTAVFATEALVGAAPSGVHLVGPSLRAEKVEIASPGTEAPLVYVSFGSQAWYQPRRYRVLAQAAERCGAALVMAMGDLAHELGPELESATVSCVPVAPQLAMLKNARAFVTHGGANSVMEGLAYGVPLLISPICNDQVHNLQIAESVGAARGIDLDTASVETVAAALRSVLADGAHRHAAQEISRSYRARNGGRGAAALAAPFLS